MKRKLNEVDVPVPKDLTGKSEAAQASGFDALGLDARLLQAVSKHNFSTPTPVQAQAIPLALSGRDILARSQTGSGKTAAYVLPVLHSILKQKNSRPNESNIAALILVPTRELAQQTSKVITSFCAYCANDVRAVDLTQKVAETVQRTWLAESPDIVVATPARAAQCINNSTLLLHHLENLILDEADLVLSYGYDNDLQVIAEALPKSVRTTLMSATLSTDIDTLKGIFCHDPVAIDLQETTQETSGVTQYTVKCSEDDKFLLVYVIFKLKLIKGKCIVFVGDIDRCYRVKLVLEQFGVRSCVLNSELPVNSRIHVVEQFNKGVYDIIIASDEHEVVGESETSQLHTSPTDIATTEQNGETNETHEAPAESPNHPAHKKPKKKAKKSKEYGIARGIDFQHVAAVLNFDFPSSPKSYTHRIGRTARAGKSGLALSFIVPTSLYNKHKPTTFPTAAHDEIILEQVTQQETRRGRKLEPYSFDERQLTAFRYRMNDALRAVTRVAIREARMRELRQEFLKSEKLKRHFEENPEDLRGLRHDGELRAARVQPHLKHVPDYLMPNKGGAAAQGVGKEGDIGFVGFRKEADNRHRRRGKVSRRAATRRADPLKTFNARGRGKK